MLGKMFSGLGQVMGGQPQFTPPIMPQGGQAQGVGGMFAKPKLSTAQKIAGLGALLRDAGDMGLGRNNDHFGRFQHGAEQQMAQAAQQNRVAQMLGQMNGQPPQAGQVPQGGQAPQGGQSPQGGQQPQYSLSMVAAAYNNPAAFAAELAKRNLGVHQITGGNSVYNPQTGGFSQAPQNLQNGSRVATVGPNGMTTYDMGANQAELNTRYANQSTRQNYLATQKLREGELDATIDNNNMVNDRGVYANQTGRMNAGTNRLNAGVNQQNADTTAARLTYDMTNPQGDANSYFGTPVLGTDADGNPLVAQLGRNGQPKVVDFGGGFSPLGVGERAQQSASGRATGKAQGEALSKAPIADNAMVEALKSVNALRDHAGRKAATGGSSFWNRFAMPGGERKDFLVQLEQATNQTFMQARAELKGGGQITDFEGVKAEKAIAKMDAAQSEGAFLAALDDYETALTNARRAMQEVERGGAGGVTGQDWQDVYSDGTIIDGPDGQSMIMRNGQWEPHNG